MIGEGLVLEADVGVEHGGLRGLPVKSTAKRSARAKFLRGAPSSL